MLWRFGIFRYFSLSQSSAAAAARLVRQFIFVFLRRGLFSYRVAAGGVPLRVSCLWPSILALPASSSRAARAKQRRDVSDCRARALSVVYVWRTAARCAALHSLMHFGGALLC